MAFTPLKPIYSYLSTNLRTLAFVNKKNQFFKNSSCFIAHFTLRTIIFIRYDLFIVNERMIIMLINDNNQEITTIQIKKLLMLKILNANLKTAN
jgi:hypothetical protein